MINLKIIEKSKTWLGISVVLTVVSLGALLVMGLNYGIDFLGGTIVTINLHQTFETEEVRSIVDAYDDGADITFGGEEKELVIINTKVSLDTTQRAELFDQFQEKYDLAEEDLISVDTVSATVGGETAQNAVIASLVAIVLMLVYVTFRFEFYFGLAAVIALIHDIIVVIGVYSVFSIQVNSPFIAAILTILGYSINDTIVVFDRIRDNENLIGISDLTTLVDTSVSQTLKRSLNTVATTLIAILALYFFGVNAIKDFALPLIVGIACGCYSSIFVASPLWVIFQKKFKNSEYNKKSKQRTPRNKTKKQDKAIQI